MENMAIDPIFWKNKSVLLTGHTGFKGSWLSLWLSSMGANLTGFSLPPSTQPNLFNILNIEDSFQSIIGDIRHFDLLQKTVDKAKPEIIIHMAAQSLVRESYNSPIDTYSTNVMGTVHILEAARLSGSVRAVVNITSDKCYDNQERSDYGYTENDAMGGYDPYSNSKGCAELVTSAYRSSFFNSKTYNNHHIAIASARAGNVIGGGDWAQNRLIPDFIRAITNKEELIIRNPLSIRPWQHVLEPLSGYLMLAQELYKEGAEYAEAWNFGPLEVEVKNVEWIANKLTHYWAEGSKFSKDHNIMNPHEANYLKLNIKKAMSKLKWQPRWDINETIKRTCLWYKANFNQKNMREYSLNEIDEYLNSSYL
jgi:CDP-glucose 4,6-dehydratase